MHRQATSRAVSDMHEVSMAEKVTQQEWQLKEEKEKRKRLKLELRAATVELGSQVARNTEMRQQFTMNEKKMRESYEDSESGLSRAT